MAPSCMKTEKTVAFSPVKFRRSPVMMRCPVEETGRNSVSPSTMLNMTADQMLSIMFLIFGNE